MKLKMITATIANQKGGQAKTTVTAHLAHAAVDRGSRVLLIDMDRQGSLSLSFPPAEGAKPGLVASSLFSSQPLDQQPEIISDQLSIIRSDVLLEQLNGSVQDAAQRPKRHIKAFADQFDVCFIDTPGVIGFNPPMTIAALVAADVVVCPFSIGKYEAASLADLWAYLEQVKKPAYNPRLRVMGLLPSKISKGKMIQDALSKIRKDLGPLVIPGMLAERAAVHQATMLGRPVWKNAKGESTSVAAKEWRSMCNYILDNLHGISK